MIPNILPSVSGLEIKRTILYILVSLLCTLQPVLAQTERAPKQGFLVRLSENNFRLTRNQQVTLDVDLLRSKRARNTEINLRVPGHLPEGLSVDIDQPDYGTSGKVILKTDNSFPENNFTLVIQGRAPGYSRSIALYINQMDHSGALKQ